MCCPKCWPGSRVQEACGELRTTVCEPCMPGTYTPHLNALHECLPCRVCDPGLGQVTRRKCSAQTNTVCGCGRGHFCVRQDGDACVQCRPHSVCLPGQRVRETGIEWEDTLCEDCQPGTFSAGGTQAACMPWTKCSGPLSWEVTPGTSSSDVTCSPLGPIVILMILVILVIAVISVPLVLRAIRDRTARGELAFLGVLLPVPTLEWTGEPAERTGIGTCRPPGSSQTSPRIPWRRQHPCSLRGTRHLTHGCGMQAPEPSPRGCGQRPGPHGPATGLGEPRDPLLEASPHLPEEETTCWARGFGTPRVSPPGS